MSLPGFSALDQGFWNLYNFPNSGEECELEIEQEKCGFITDARRGNAMLWKLYQI